MSHARISVDADRPIGSIDRRMYGVLVEHLGRCVYTGIFEPDHPTADADGFRQDVMDLVKELGVTIARYPGGNFVSNYRWEDGIGPVAERPSRLELAWHSTETNAFGLDEFMAWCSKAGVEPMMAINLGTRGEEDAINILDYTNGVCATEYADKRRANGHEDAYNVRMWCLGNEMDGPWQVGHKNAEDYAYLAGSTARAMKMVDQDLELVACGSAAWEMPTFGDWERTILELNYDEVDFISMHRYVDPDVQDRASFLAAGYDMDRFIDGVIATADAVGAKKRSTKKIQISVDEWNVWRLSEWNSIEHGFDPADWPVAPKRIEDVYTAADALALGGMLISLLRHADRVKTACIAQLVNVIAPIMTEKGGRAWRQATFHPFAIGSRIARGTAYDAVVETASTATERYGDVDQVDAVVTWDEETGKGSLLALNRSLTESADLSAALASLGVSRVVEAQILAPEDLDAVNTADEPDAVAPVAHEVTLSDGVLTTTLPPASWLAVELG
ncbi:MULTISPECIES: alpha-N-arabinofuranosidase [unclassified Actinomyces]|uniref:arabinosylfuranosidase ArfA n=1 Tax=unclassified Actinomyces TaxID=2609248 RepID=UPI002018104A|nr:MULTISPECIES: alpha-N-arabinofuranosidase [unclassified Actinomyces]MCL3777125.1 alpha-N-arabinofuranosidase [Actinomyces sp. AC-20-1]MCL3788959.1 alpha-N-arabinofuranosidase [Actinomyces sp. 187325]MCL3791311.1 alpha-N-arabinofuranosidase [Actinomyces sp. 186855]MCL3794142.1 alpha-N-arabinofuranosidase [Actinomyces sp. 217892]